MQHNNKENEMLQSDQQNSLMGRCLIFKKKIVIVMVIRHFRGGPVVNNLPSSARDMGPIPYWELRSHILGELSQRAATTEPVCHNSDPTQPNKINT